MDANTINYAAPKIAETPGATKKLPAPVKSIQNIKEDAPTPKQESKQEPAKTGAPLSTSPTKAAKKESPLPVSTVKTTPPPPPQPSKVQPPQQMEKPANTPKDEKKKVAEQKLTKRGDND